MHACFKASIFFNKSTYMTLHLNVSMDILDFIKYDHLISPYFILGRLGGSKYIFSLSMYSRIYRSLSLKISFSIFYLSAIGHRQISLRNNITTFKKIYRTDKLCVLGSFYLWTYFGIFCQLISLNHIFIECFLSFSKESKIYLPSESLRWFVGGL